MKWFEITPSHLKKANNFQRSAWALVKSNKELGQKQVYIVADHKQDVLRTNARVIGAMDEQDHAELRERLHQIDSGTGVQTEVGIILTSNSRNILSALVAEFDKFGHTWGAESKSAPDILTDMNHADSLAWYLKTVYSFTYPYGL